VTQPLNSALSNAPWQKTATNPHSKRTELAKRSVLLVNQRLCEHQTRDEQLIDERSTDLAERVFRTWPGPDSEVWPAFKRAAANCVVTQDCAGTSIRPVSVRVSTSYRGGVRLRPRA
jgi:hypothetical protein